MKDRAFALQFLSQFDEVEDLAVVHNHGIAIGAEDRLVTSGDVEDGEPRCAQRNLFALKPCFLIGPTMGNRIHCVS